MKLSTTITKKNFEMKMQDIKTDGFFLEYKEEKPFWKKRLDSLLKEYDLRAYGFLGKLPEIVFLVGNKPHRFKIAGIYYTHSIPERYAPAINTEFCYAIKCIPLKQGEI